jgi:hypothetical protein
VKSKQINFFAVPEDLKIFQEYFIAQHILFIKLPLRESKNITTENITERGDAKEWAKVYLTKEEFLTHVTTNLVDTQNYYLIDDMVSSVIEFVRPLPDIYNGRIERARLYYVQSYYDKEGKLVDKDDKFLKWADNLIKDFAKKFLVKVEAAGNNRYTKATLKNLNEGKIRDCLPLKAYFKLF